VWKDWDTPVGCRVSTSPQPQKPLSWTCLDKVFDVGSVLKRISNTALSLDGFIFPSAEGVCILNV
jgi:hypothetical protein